MTYAATITRPDLAVAMGTLSQHMFNPSKEHWIGVKRVLRYVKGTLSCELKFSVDENGAKILSYSINVVLHLNMYLKLVIPLLPGQQATVAKSWTEAEYVVLSIATKDAIWLCGSINRPITILEDDRRPLNCHEIQNIIIGQNILMLVITLFMRELSLMKLMSNMLVDNMTI